MKRLELINYIGTYSWNNRFNEPTKMELALNHAAADVHDQEYYKQQTNDIMEELR